MDLNIFAVFKLFLISDMNETIREFLVFMETLMKSLPLKE